MDDRKKAGHKIFAAVFLLLAACSSPAPGPSGEKSSFVVVRQTTIRGVAYKAWMKSGSYNLYVAEAAGDGPGSAFGASAAVIKLFNCQRAKMVPRDDSARRFEGRGSFCDPFRDWQPLR